MTFTTGQNGSYAERMRIDSSGNVGIGTSSPNNYSSQTTLTINGSTYGRLDLESAGTLRASLFATTGSTTLSAATDVLSFDTSGTSNGVSTLVVDYLLALRLTAMQV